MTITGTDAESAVLDQDGRLRTLHLNLPTVRNTRGPDGKKYKSDQGNTAIKTRGDKRRLVVETRQADGPRFTETFSVAPDRSQLIVDVRVEGQLVSVRRVYEPQPQE